MKRCYVPDPLYRAHRGHTTTQCVGMVIVAVVLVVIVGIGMLGAPTP